ncbi:MAG: hypothetical protein JSS87_10995 [Acidobacteria bacterium]|nr:hypothetical protein [Acidobacteriota bacterium]
MSSYAPLLLITAVKYHAKHPHLALTLTGLALVSVLALKLFLSSAAKLGSSSITVEQISAKDTEGMSYIVTYLIPFLDLKLEEPASAIALFFLFAVVGILYVNSNMIYINPTINLLGYHLFEIETSSKKREALLTKRGYIERGSVIQGISLGNLVVLEK